MSKLSASRRTGLASALKIALALFALIAVLAYGVDKRAATWEQEAVATQPTAVPEATAPAVPVGPAAVPPVRAGRRPPPVQAGRRPPPDRLLPVDNSSLTRLGPRAPAPPTAPAAPSATPDDTAVRPKLLARPVALDTGSFQIGRGLLRLEGIEPVVPTETCGTGAAAWPCGMKARTALRSFVRSRSIKCAVPGNFGTVEATVESACSLGDVDLGQWLVANGWARASDDGRYSVVEKKARAEGLGLWAERDLSAPASIVPFPEPSAPEPPEDVTPPPAGLPGPPQ